MSFRQITAATYREAMRTRLRHNREFVAQDYCARQQSLALTYGDRTITLEFVAGYFVACCEEIEFLEAYLGEVQKRITQ